MIETKETTAMYTKRTVASKEEQKIPFSYTDAKGRVIGVIIETAMVVFEDNERNDGGYNFAPGVYFYACVQASRDGVSFGASQYGEHFKSEEERTAYVSKRLSASRKAAQKVWNKAEAAKLPSQR
jgi:hypothetical protein